MSIDDDIEEALGAPFGWYSDDIRDLFVGGAGDLLARVVCGMCGGNREIASVRRLSFNGAQLLVAGRYEQVALRGTLVRRVLMAHDAPSDPRNGHRRAPRVMIIEPVDGSITAWCRKHGQLLVPSRAVETAIQQYDQHAVTRPPAKPQTIRFGAEPARGAR